MKSALNLHNEQKIHLTSIYFQLIFVLNLRDRISIEVNSLPERLGVPLLGVHMHMIWGGNPPKGVPFKSFSKCIFLIRK